ncbi:hypothetical protein G6L16_009055 [Agrobacterium tumefaciens]|uniref:hypothetical protein n=1 Tax=Agrobacterium tumefaciens TaxID=358 RepID=UPI001571AD30|nr:hypothetical protein [Agrobacterium tumefaciens]NSZ63487.1 hypothetical protein [Agrobacterium tumefaciens]NTA69857.1 hypothetical protein [Agrobacterium tumefaciens]WIE37002.1 hypothetical protein G6L16_009055 [Agrobacterium tumefaciens]
MLAEGHVHAEHYTVGKVWEENQLVVERVNRHHATTATILSAVMTSAVAAFGKKKDAEKAGEALKELIENLNGSNDRDDESTSAKPTKDISELLKRKG